MMARKPQGDAGPVRHEFSSRAGLATALADKVAARLTAAIKAKGSATLAVSGGSTPGLLFDALSTRSIDWPAVIVTLVDERFVPETSDRSNGRLVRGKLLKNKAAAARFVPLYRDGRSLDECVTDAQMALVKNLPDVVLLGMGNDGHTASFFPDARELDTLLDPTGEAIVGAVHADTAGEPRLTLTLPPIADAPFVALHIEGDDKAKTLERALEAGSTLPVRRVMDATRRPIEIFWAA